MPHVAAALSPRSWTFATAAAITAAGLALLFAFGGAKTDFTTGQLGAVTTTVVGIGLAAVEGIRFRSLALLMTGVVAVQVLADLWRTPGVLGYEIAAVGIAGLWLATRMPLPKASPARANALGEESRSGHGLAQMHAR